LFSDAPAIIGDQMTPKTVNVEEAGQILGIGRNSAYEAVRRGEIPVIKIGKLLRVPVVALERMLEEARPTSRDST
jgi:excisionase family DNA binding protein